MEQSSRLHGERELQEACKPLSPLELGQAVITPGFNLPAKYIIHTVGPVYRDGNSDEARLLSLILRRKL